MRTKAAADAIAGLLALPILSAGSPQDGPPRVRLKTSAQLTDGGNTSSLDATRWYEGYLVASDSDSISLAISPAGDASGMRIPRWAIAAVEKVFREGHGARPR